MKMIVRYWNKKGECVKYEAVDIHNFSISEFNKRKYAKITFSEILLFDQDIGRDMTMCVPGDLLISKHGMILTYIEESPSHDYYDHKVMYPDGSFGTRIDSGHTYKYVEKRLHEDQDIIGVVI